MDKKMEEFEKFKQYFLKWQKLLGLNDWRVIYFQKMPFEQDSPYARVNYIPTQHECWVYFWGCNYKNLNVEEKAFHEVCHLLLADLAELSDKDTNMEEHSVINRLIGLLESNFEKGGEDGGKKEDCKQEGGKEGQGCQRCGKSQEGSREK